MASPSPQSSGRLSTAPDFLLSRPHGSVRSQGSREEFRSAYDASTHIRDLMSSEAASSQMVVGCVPFDFNEPAALTVPEKIWRSEGPLEPPAAYRGDDSRLTVSNISFSSDATSHAHVVAAAVDTIASTELEKVVLARYADVQFAERVDPLLICARMIDLSSHRDGYGVQLPADLGGSFFTGSSPEVLIKRHGENFSAFPLAGSIQRSRDKQQEQRSIEQMRKSPKELYEHRLVVDHYRRVLEPLSRELNIPPTPGIHSTKEMIHLGTPITGQLKDRDYSALDLALLLHPTPAVGGTPTEAALGVISAAEEESRGMYAGFVGWCDASGDGEYMVSIRGTTVAQDGLAARSWAGGGIVSSSDPAAEARETAAKMRTALRAMNVPAELFEKLN